MESHINFKGLECHFNWDIRSVVGTKEVANKLSEKNEEIAGQPWRNMLITLTLAYELHMQKNSDANEKLQEVITMWGNNDDEFILKYKDAFRHVIYSLKLFFIKDNSSKNIIKEIYDYIPPYNTLPTQQKAAITAIKAHVFSEYGVEGTKHALTLARDAVRGNPLEGEWSFLVAKMMSRIRQFTLDQCVTEDELECFRHAYSLSKSPAHAVFLAQTYCSLSKALYYQLPLYKGRRLLNDNEGRIIKGYNEKAYKLFMESLEGNNNKCIHINFRCARGLFKLPGEFKNIEKALDIVEKTLERAPTNVYGNSTACNIYAALNQYDKAFKHADAAEVGGSYGMSIKKIQMKIDLKHDINIEEAFENVFKLHPEMIYIIQTSMNAMSYYIFKKRNIFQALKYFFKAADWNATLDDFHVYIYWIKDRTDMCFIVYNEVKSAIERNKSKNVRQLKQLKDAITIVNTQYPKVTERKLQPDLVDYLLKRIQRFPRKQYNFKNTNRNNHERNKGISDNKDNVSGRDKKNNFQRKKPQENKKNNENRPARRRTSRTRTDSECSNVSGCSVASGSSFTKIRKNSKEACLLDIVTKDLELANVCKDVKEANNTTGTTTLRPCQDNNRPILGFNPKEKKPLGMGCSGWNTKTLSNENLTKLNKNKNFNKPQNNTSQLNQWFNNLKISGNNNSDYKTRESRSLSSDNRRQDNEKKGITISRNNPPYNRSVSTDRKQNRPWSSSDHEKNTTSIVQRSLSICSDGAIGGNNNNVQFEQFNQTEKRNEVFNKMKNKSFYRDVYYDSGNVQNNRRYSSTGENSKERDNRQGGYYNQTYNNQRSNFGQNRGRGGRSYNNTPGGGSNNKGPQIRKPFNLNRDDSLDSDDSVSLRSYSSDRRLSISSVDSDYVRDSSVAYFPWQKKAGSHKK